jgi:hypothetical protein
MRRASGIGQVAKRGGSVLTKRYEDRSSFANQARSWDRRGKTSGDVVEQSTTMKAWRMLVG